MPAQSPTLSPTLSAMVAALRGSSSGMPASTLPTMSPPTSAPLVKMPPPRRAKIEIRLAPKPRATSESTTSRPVASPGRGPGSGRRSSPPRPIRAKPATSMPVMAPEVKARFMPFARLSLAAWAVRTLARTEISMPAKPAAPDSTAPMRKPPAAQRADQDGDTMIRITTPTMRWSCTDGADRPGRLPGSPRRSPASWRCPRVCRAAPTVWTMRVEHRQYAGGDHQPKI